MTRKLNPLNCKTRKKRIKLIEVRRLSLVNKKNMTTLSKFLSISSLFILVFCCFDTQNDVYMVSVDQIKPP